MMMSASAPSLDTIAKAIVGQLPLLWIAAGTVALTPRREQCECVFALLGWVKSVHEEVVVSIIPTPFRNRS